MQQPIDSNYSEAHVIIEIIRLIIFLTLFNLLSSILRQLGRPYTVFFLLIHFKYYEVSLAIATKGLAMIQDVFIACLYVTLAMFASQAKLSASL